MVTDSHADGEGELLRRVRAIVGPKVPVAVSLDLHSNTTPAMFANSELLVAYRYPPIDDGQPRDGRPRGVLPQAAHQRHGPRRHGVAGDLIIRSQRSALICSPATIFTNWLANSDPVTWRAPPSRRAFRQRDFDGCAPGRLGLMAPTEPLPPMQRANWNVACWRGRRRMGRAGAGRGGGGARGAVDCGHSAQARGDRGHAGQPRRRWRQRHHGHGAGIA